MSKQVEYMAKHLYKRLDAYIQLWYMDLQELLLSSFRLLFIVHCILTKSPFFDRGDVKLDYDEELQVSHPSLFLFHQQRTRYYFEYIRYFRLFKWISVCQLRQVYAGNSCCCTRHLQKPTLISISCGYFLNYVNLEWEWQVNLLRFLQIDLVNQHYDRL